MAKTGTVGLIGIGVMGQVIARNLVASGFDVVGYDIAAAARDTLAAIGGKPAASNADALQQASVVISSLPSGRALLDVAAELAATGTSGRVLAETSTLTLADKQAAHDRLASAGIAMLDCPLSGSANRAALRDVLVYASGDKAAYNQAKPVFDGFSDKPMYVGAFGAGSKLKYIANHLVAIHTAAAGEAFALARKAGLDAATVYDAIIGGAGGSRAMQARQTMLVSNTYRPVETASFDIFAKDLQVIGAFADDVGCPVPMFTATLPLYKAAIAQGMGADDMAAISLLLQRMAGMPPTDDNT